ncbi:helix-turn-helix domain-containing protein [Mesorhizobium sp. WSM3876]|uniref:helix-turn-helix transcriptional regulator n=1 Tax=Mesorhizobium sp. WSM3876 TaxID=422277 RepID=UPI000BD213D1|nr:helix-turn-helix domain-containing protein [Mesorhizobium sp. WSM3876]PBB85719.1 hypothetical protein CK216_16460 [Mesorhizobium sp. WSM3876]
MQDDPRLTAKEICADYKISPNTLYRLINKGLIPRGEPAGIRAVRWRKSVIEKAFLSIGRAA